MFYLSTRGDVRSALDSGDLGLIIRAYRAATGSSQRHVADLLGYDATYISMIETHRREIKDAASRLRIARRLGIPAHTLGVSDPADSDTTTLLAVAGSVIRLAAIARQSGRGAEAVNELWPLVGRLETRAAQGAVDLGAACLLARARAELGVSLGYVPPEERLSGAARWTGRALRLAERLGEPDLVAHALRVHGNELRKVGRPAAAVARLRRATALIPATERLTGLLQLARAAGDLGDGALFDAAVRAGDGAVQAGLGDGLANAAVLQEVRLRGLMATNRAGSAAKLLAHWHTPTAVLPPQWRAIAAVTTGEVLLTRGEHAGAADEFRAAIASAEPHRLPHQLQRIVRATMRHLPDMADEARRALGRLAIPHQPSARRVVPRSP